MLTRRSIGIPVLLTVILSLGASMGMAQEKIALPFAERQARATLQMSNDALDLYFNERYSDTWLFEYSPGVQGESCYYEHFAIWTPAGIRESDGFTVQQEFSTPSGGVSTCVVLSDPFEVR
jgi:hypothetical protein